MHKTLLSICFVTLLFSCQQEKANAPEVKEVSPTRTEQVKEKATAFFDTFADRSDWKKFCSYYREDVEFQDIVLQLNLDSLWQFKRFYDWDSPTNEFKKLTPDQRHLVVESLVVDDSIAVGRGHFNPFYFNGELIDPAWGVEFTIWLYFDKDLKIKRQVDWIEYDTYVLEATVEWCKKNGHEATPDWLDLSRKESEE